MRTVIVNPFGPELDFTGDEISAVELLKLPEEVRKEMMLPEPNPIPEGGIFLRFFDSVAFLANESMVKFVSEIIATYYVGILIPHDANFKEWAPPAEIYDLKRMTGEDEFDLILVVEHGINKKHPDTDTFTFMHVEDLFDWYIHDYREVAIPSLS